MIEIELPDGTIAEFPEGTSQDVIKSALQKRFAKQAIIPAPSAPTAPQQAYMEARARGEMPAPVPMDNVLATRQAAIDAQTNAVVRRLQADQAQAATTPQVGPAGAALLGAGQGATFGLSDEMIAGLSAFLPNQTYAEELPKVRAMMAAAQEQNPLTSAVSNIGGAIATLPVTGTANATTKIAQALGGGMAGKVAASGLTGAGLSGVYGFGTGEGGLQNRLENAAQNALVGAAIGGAIPIVGGGANKLINSLMKGRAVRAAAKNAPSTEELRALGSQAYKAVEDAGVMIEPHAFAGAAGKTLANMTAGGMRQDVGRSLAPKSADLAQVIKEIATDERYAQGIPFSEVDILRRLAGAPASDMGNKLERSLGEKAIAGIDDFVENLTPAQTTAGNAADLPDLIKAARGIWSKMSKSQMIDDAIENSQNYLSGEASGIRNQFGRILKSPKLSRGFSEVEKELMRKVVNGSIPEQLLNLAGGGIGQLVTMAGGAGLGAGGGPAGAAIGGLIGAGLAAGARKGSEALAKRNAEMVRAIIANGGLQSVPHVNPQVRNIAEAIMRRGVAAGQQ